jgi:hypothetical protein
VNGHGDLIETRERLTRAVLAMLLAERQLASEAAGVAALRKREDAVSLAARDLANRIADLPPAMRPKGWALDGDEAG